MFINADIHRDIKPADYHAWNAGKSRNARDWRLSRSEILDILDCPEMFRQGGRFLSGKSINTGSLVDAMLTTPDALGDLYAHAPETYDKEVTRGRGDKKTTTIEKKPWNWNSNTCKEWRKEQEEAGKTVVTQKEWNEAGEIAKSVRHSPIGLGAQTLGQLIEECEGQIVLTADWQCPETDEIVPVRAMPDLVRSHILYDLKTSQEASRKKFKGSIIAYGYDVQAWMYSAIFAAATKQATVPFGFIVVRNSAPYLVATYKASEETLTWGETKFREAMADYIECRREQSWPGYTTHFEEI